MSHCKDCKWWDQHGDTDKYGNCHRYPPTVERDVSKSLKHPIDEQFTEISPQTPAAGWCGEFTVRYITCACKAEVLVPLGHKPTSIVTTEHCEVCNGTGKIDTQP